MWIDIKGFEGCYKVNNNGEVMSLDRLNSRGYIQKGRILKPRIEGGGYAFVTLHYGEKIKQWKVHRIVATHFIPNPKNHICVNHINGIKTDNRVENLEWCSYGENKSHSFRVLNEVHWHQGKLGKDCKYSKIVLKIDDDNNITEYFGTQEAHRETGISQGNISAVCRGERKKAGGFKWRYKNQ